MGLNGAWVPLWEALRQSALEAQSTADAIVLGVAGLTFLFSVSVSVSFPIKDHQNHENDP